MQGETLLYLERVVNKFSLVAHIKCCSTVVLGRWCDASHQYTVTMEDGERLVFDVVASAMEFFNEASLPVWPGWDRFQGAKFHSARWERHHELDDKRVQLMGVGAGPAQSLQFGVVGVGEASPPQASRRHPRPGPRCHTRRPLRRGFRSRTQR